jgi:GTPase SAR1 family protein
VVLVGDSGVGKTGLSLALTNQPFVATESTHGRHIWNLDRQEISFPDKRRELRETILWDLAGQAGYRLIHQLHLSEVTVALVVFDFRSETNPFAGIDHWVRALYVAQLLQSPDAPPMKKFLVAARVDRSGKSVSLERIHKLARRYGFDDYFETSAKEGTGIPELQEAIKQAIDWEMFTRRTSTTFFQHIKEFIVVEKESKRLLSTHEELYRAFLHIEGLDKKRDIDDENIRAQFETCIGFAESNDLIRRLSFGNLILLQPELLDAYISSLINSVRDQPDGLGSIAEDQVRAGDFTMQTGERLEDENQEKLLLLAMIEDLLRYELALREQGNDGAYLIFPSQSTRENPDLPNPEGRAVIFSFEGPIGNIYTTLAVRLSHSGLFEKKELWKNAIMYTTRAGGNYGLFLQYIGDAEGRADLTLFFDKAASEEMRFHFEEFVNAHLQRHAIPESLQRRRMFVCQTCGTTMDDVQVQKRQERNLNWMTCGVCDAKVSLLDREELLVTVPSSLVAEMDNLANERRERSARVTTIEGKIATSDFDVFLCYNNENKQQIKQIGEQLKEHGILPWLDEWELRPGLPWQRVLERQIGKIKAAAVFVGQDGIGPWQHMELESYLRKFVHNDYPVIPVLLEDASQQPGLPPFLEGMTWVDFRKTEPDPMKQLIWGITGERYSLES